MFKKVRLNVKIASGLPLLYSLLIVIDYYFDNELHSNFGILLVIFTIIIFIGIAYWITKGYKLIRWILLIITLLEIPFTINNFPVNFKINITRGYISVVEYLIQIIICVLLFIPNKSNLNQQTQISES